MKIGVNTLFLIPGQVGGTETYLREVLLAMPRETTHELVIFTNRENSGPMREILAGKPGVSFVDLGVAGQSRPARIMVEQTRLPAAARRAGINVLWSPGYTAPFVCYCPQVVTIHDMQYTSFPEDMSFPARVASAVLIPGAARRCDAVITGTRFSRDEILTHTRVVPERVHVIHDGVTRAFEMMPAAANVPDGAYLLCVASTYPHKNINALVDAFGQVCDSIPHRLILVGAEAGGEQRVQEAISGLPDSSRVLRLSGISQDELVALYHGASAFLMPSLYEGFCLPILEAMLARTPVIASRSGAIPEVGSDCILYFDEQPDAGNMAEGIRRVIDDKDDARLDRAVDRAREFTWEKTAEETLRVFELAATGEEINAQHPTPNAQRPGI